MSKNQQLAKDTVIHLADHMERLKEAVRVFKNSTAVRDRGYFNPTEDDQVVHLWVSYHMARNALLELITEYQHTYAANQDADLADFAIALAAAVVLVDAARLLREEFRDEPLVRRKLNESYELYGIPADSFDAIQISLSDPAHAVQLYNATHFFDEHEAKLRQETAADDSLQVVLKIIDRLLDRLRVSPTAYAKALANERCRNLYDSVIHSAVGQAIYAVQSWFSRWIGQLSTQPSHQPALPEPIKAELLGLLQPGDVLVTRKEHSLTNYFLPGYWPHAALYIGQGRVIEALADGVRERSVDSPFAVDAIAAIRPRLGESQIDEALDRARTHVGKPYDFDFDFTRADRMVCTEVVYRSYHGIGNVEFQLTRRAARETLSAEDLLNLSRQQQFFQHVAVFCPQHCAELLNDSDIEPVFQATIDG